MRKLLLLSIFISSCASVRPGPIVTHKVITDQEAIFKDVYACEQIAKGLSNIQETFREMQTECLEKRGYQIVGWN